MPVAQIGSKDVCGPVERVKVRPVKFCAPGASERRRPPGGAKFKIQKIPTVSSIKVTHLELNIDHVETKNTCIIRL